MNSWLIGKDPDAGNDWRQEERVTEDEMIGWHHQFNGQNLGKFWEMVRDREAWCAADYGVVKSRTQLQIRQFNSVAQSCSTLCSPMDCSILGFPVYHRLPELAQTHVDWVGDAIQPTDSHSSTSPPVFNLSQHQGLFQRLSSSHQGAKVLESQLQHQSFWKVVADRWKDTGILGLQKRRIQSWPRDEAWSLRAFVQ